MRSSTVTACRPFRSDVPSACSRELRLGPASAVALVGPRPRTARREPDRREAGSRGPGSHRHRQAGRLRESERRAREGRDSGHGKFRSRSAACSRSGYGRSVKTLRGPPRRVDGIPRAGGKSATEGKNRKGRDQRSFARIGRSSNGHRGRIAHGSTPETGSPTRSSELGASGARRRCARSAFCR
jgi:hypothetical protein